MYTYKMHFTRDQEIFMYDAFGYQGPAATQKKYPYLESLLSFLELDITEVNLQIQEIAETWDHYFTASDTSHGDTAMQLMGALAARHIYFQLLYLQWFSKKVDETLEPAMTEELRLLPEQLLSCQKQAQAYIEEVLDFDHVGRDTRSNARKYYFKDAALSVPLFPFETLLINFEPVDTETCGAILQPRSIRDLVDFSLRECVSHGIPVRRCKSCGRYFPLTGRVSAEYCSRSNPVRKLCSETGAVHKWTERRMGSDVFKEYRREYKRRFAWIKAGKITAESFYSWSEKAREKKTECDSGAISLKAYREWLRNS